MRLHKSLPHERIMLTVRRHWFIFVTRLSVNILLLLVPIPLIWYGGVYFSELLSSDLVYPIIVLFLTIYYLAIWLVFFLTFIDLYLDVWIVTNKRIINIEQFGLFSRTESEHQLSVIQDISTEVNGIFPTIFNYGDMHIQTAGESQRVTFKQIPEPYYVKKIISDMIERSLKESAELGTTTNKL